MHFANWMTLLKKETFANELRRMALSGPQWFRYIE